MMLFAVSQAAAAPRTSSASKTATGAVTITQADLEKLRRRGSLEIEPAPATREQMERHGARKVSTDVKLCISRLGTVESAEIAKPSGYEAYDLRVRADVADWQFDPYQQNGRGVQACTTVTVTYQPPNPQGPDRGPLARALTATTKPELAALRADVNMFCGAARATRATSFIEMGPYIAERMKTDLLEDHFATLRSGGTTLDMIVEQVRLGMAKVRVKRCATIDMLLKRRRK
jgi:TonB family protein